MSLSTPESVNGIAVEGMCFGALYRINDQEERLNYLAGVEVQKASSLPDGMEAIELPECRYAQFAHRGDVARLDNTVNYAYSNWLLNSGFRHTYGPDLELYGPGYRASSSDSLIHYAMPVERPR